MYMQRRRDQEPAILGAAGNLPFGLVGNIVQIATTIRETSRNVTSNKEECIYLAEHIEEIVSYISQLQEIAFSNDTFRKTVIALYETMIECLEFMMQFIKASPVGHVVHNRSNKRKFAHFNQRLDQYKNRLLFGLNIRNYKLQPTKVEPPVSIKPPPSTIRPPPPSVRPPSLLNKQRNSRKLITPAGYGQRLSYNNYFMKPLSGDNSHQHRYVHYRNNRITYPIYPTNYYY